MPAAAFLLDEPVLGQAGKDAVQVVLLDAHLLGDLGNRDPGVALDQRERLGAPRAAALRAPAAAGAGAGAAFAPGRAHARGAPAGAAGAAAVRAAGVYAVERGGGGLEPLVLVDERPQLLQPRVDLISFLIKE